MGRKLNISFFLIIFCFFSIVITFGQNDDNDKWSGFTVKIPLPKSENEDYSFLVEINDKSETKVSVVISDDFNFMAMEGKQDSLANFFSNLSPRTVNSKNKSKVQKPLSARKVYIKTDPSLMFFEIESIIKTIKKSGMNKIVLLVPRDSYNEQVQFVFPADFSKEPPFPNPLILITKIDLASMIFLNTESHGTVKDLTSLEKRLKEIFKERSDNATFRRGSYEVETTVLVGALRTTKVADIMKLINSIYNAGSDSVGILIK
jgi:biopolymer transport protein ExbD